MNAEGDTVNENQRRAVTTSLCLLDEMLCRLEDWARGRERHGVLFHESNRLSLDQGQAILAEIEQARAILRELQAVFNLEAETRDVAQAVWAETAAFWETLVETQAKSLRGYGPTPPGMAEALDWRLEALIKHLDSISRTAGARPSGRSPDAPGPPQGRGGCADAGKDRP
jgi:hypothetical protein